MAHPIDSGGDGSSNSHSSSQRKKSELAPTQSGWGHLQPADGDDGPPVSLLCQPDVLLTRQHLSARTAADTGEEGPLQRDDAHSASAAAAAAAAAIAAVPLPRPLLPSQEDWSFAIEGLRAVRSPCPESAYEYAADSVAQGGCYRVYSGQPLLVIESFLLSHLSAATRGRRPNEIAAVNYTLQFIHKLLLRRQQDDLFEVNGQPTNETKLAEGLVQSNVHIWAHVMTNFQQQFYFYRREFELGAALTPRMLELRASVGGHMVTAVDYQFNALNLMRAVPISAELVRHARERATRCPISFSVNSDDSTTADSSPSPAVLAQMESIRPHVIKAIQVYGVWASQAPSNFAHRVPLLEAEWMRLMFFLQGRYDLGPAIERRLRESITLAEEHAVLSDVGVAAESLARWHLDMGAPVEAWAYLSQAWDAFLQWQCPLKLQQLAAEFGGHEGLRRVPAAAGHDLFDAASARLPSQLLAESESKQPSESESPVDERTAQVFPARPQPQDAPLASGSGAGAAIASEGLAPPLHAGSRTSSARHPADSAAPAAADPVAARPYPASSSSSNSSSRHSHSRGASVADRFSDGSSSSSSSTGGGIDLDLATVLRFASSFTVEADPEALRNLLMEGLLQAAGASRGVLILEDLDKKNAWNVELTAGVAPAHASASATGPAPRQHHQTTTDDGAGDGGVEGGNDTSGPSSFRASQLSFDMPSDRSDISAVMPLRVFQYVMSTREPCVLNDVLILPAGSPLSALASDPWFQRHRPRSALACPIFKLGRVVGLLYLEQAHHARAFNHASVQLLHLLCSQAALSLDNSRIHARLQSSHAALERQVHSRMLELHARNAQLEKEVATRQQAEEEMRAAKEEAVRAGNSKSTFLATMSHELRTPLNAVLGLARLLLATELTDEQESYLVMMTNSSHLLLTLVADVLDYSEAGRLDLELSPVRLLDVVETALMLCSDSAANKRLDLCYWCQPSACATFLLDATRVQQILLNYLSNAIKFTASGVVQVNVSAQPVSTRTQPSSDHKSANGLEPAHSNNRPSLVVLTGDPDTADVAVSPNAFLAPSSGSAWEIKIEVVDEGMGVSAAEIGNLFQSFRQAKKVQMAFGGTGLGLAISRRLAELMGGRTWCTSVVGEGSTFGVTLHASQLDLPTITALPIDAPGAAMLDVTAHAEESLVDEAHLDLDVDGDTARADAAPAAMVTVQRSPSDGEITTTPPADPSARDAASASPSACSISNPYELSSDDMGWLSTARILVLSQQSRGSTHIYGRLLRLYGATVENACGSQEAKESLRAAAKSGTPFQLVILEEGEQLRQLASVQSTSPASPCVTPSSPSLDLQEMQRQLLRATPSPCRVLAVTNRHYIHMDSSSSSTPPTNSDVLLPESAAQKVLLADNFLQSVPTRAEEQLIAPELGDVSSPLVPLGQTAADPHLQSRALAELDGLIGFLPKPFKHQTLLAVVVRELRLLREAKTGRVHAALSPVPVATPSVRGRKMEWQPFTPAASTISPPGYPSHSVAAASSSVPHSPNVPSENPVTDDRARQMLMRTATKTSFNSQPSRSSAHSSLLGKRDATEEMRGRGGGGGSNGGIDLGQIIVPGMEVASAAAPFTTPPPATGHGHARRKYGIEPIANQVQLRIILAEDNLVNQKMMLMSLRKLGFSDVLLAVDGTECVAAVEAEQAAGRGDMLLILMDSSMEPMDGLEATRIIREAHAAREEPDEGAGACATPALFCSTPDFAARILPPPGSVSSSPFSSVRTLRRFRPPYIIAQTANVTLEAQRACIAVGTDHFLPKPVRLDALVAALRLGHRTLESYRQEQQAKSTERLP